MEKIRKIILVMKVLNSALDKVILFQNIV